MIRQHFRGSGTEGNLLQYDSSIMNSKMAARKIEEISKVRALMIFMALLQSLHFWARESNVCRLDDTTSVSHSEESLKQLFTHKIIMHNIK